MIRLLALLAALWLVAPAVAQTSGTTTKSETETETTTEESADTKTEEKKTELTKEQKQEALLQSKLLGGWVRLGRNGAPISNENAMAAANKCVAESGGTTASPSAGDLLYFLNGSTLQRLEPATGSSAVVRESRVVGTSDNQPIWALNTSAGDKAVVFRDQNSVIGVVTIMLENDVVYLGCVSVIRLR